MITEFFENGYNPGDVLGAVARSLFGPMSIKSMVDVCCYRAFWTRTLPFEHSTFVDVEKPADNPPGPFVQMDVLDLEGHWDVLLCLDGLEHMSKEKGMHFLTKCAHLADLQFFLTPLGRLWVEPESVSPNAHKCGWTPEQIEQAYPGRFDFLVFWDWYREPVQFPAFMFWNRQAPGVHTRVVSEVQRVIRKKGDA